MRTRLLPGEPIGEIFVRCRRLLDLEGTAAGGGGSGVVVLRQHVLPGLLYPGLALGACLVSPVLEVCDVRRARLGCPGVGLAPLEDNVVDVAAAEFTVLVVAHGECLSQLSRA
jgi:hypothetical protein